MRILHFIPNLSGGGAERQLSYLAPELARMGHDVHLAYSKEGPDKPELPGVVLHQLKLRSNYDPYLLLQLVRLIRRIKPDIIHTWILQMDILGGIAARLNRIPWIFREPNSAMAYSMTWKHRLRVRVGSGASAIVSNSQGGDEYWKTQLPYSHRYVVPNAVPMDEIDTVNQKTLLEYGITSDKKVVLYAGRFVEQKNIRNMVKAMLQITEDTKIVAFLCGEGSLLTEVKQDLRQANAVNRIFLPGYVGDIWGMMKRADVFVSLSHFEGRPNAVIEAMACGTPLVVSDIPEHREFLNEQSAVFVNWHEPADIETAIKDCLVKPETARQRAEVAKNITAKWSMQNIAQLYVQMYRDVLAVRGC